MTIQTVEKRAGLTAAFVRREGAAGSGQLTPQDAPLLTPARRTRRYSPRARKCARKGCDAVFTPHAKHGRFCSDNCRKADARRRGKKLVKSKSVERDLIQATCCYCGGTFLPEAGRGARYCSDSHKELAYRQRRAAAVAALIGDLGGMNEQDAADLIEREGMETISRYLHQQGYTFDQQARRWLMAVEPGSVFVMYEVPNGGRDNGK